MTRLVDRYGRTGFAALTSVIWALPMAAWAGSSDLSPIDQTAYPWVALAIGLAMLAVWIVLLTRLGKIPVTRRQRRFDIGQMTPLEKRWTLATFAFGAGVIAWLNASATVDWTPMILAVKQGKAGPTLLAVGLALYLVTVLAGLAFSWRKESDAYQRRLAEAASRPLSM